MQILEAVESVNDFQKSVLFNKIKKHFGSLEGKHFAMWGLAFKPKTDDMREAPSLVIIEKLLSEGATVTAYDPVAMHEAEKTLGNSIKFAKTQYDTLDNADALLIVTEWPEFRAPKFEEISLRLKNKVIFDGRNIYEPTEMQELGYTYSCIGRKVPATISRF
jgi:UDPglucose 6-dehydrogenase